MDESELATREWPDWLNHHRLLGAVGYVPPAEYEADGVVHESVSWHGFKQQNRYETRGGSEYWR